MSARLRECPICGRGIFIGKSKRCCADCRKVISNIVARVLGHNVPKRKKRDVPWRETAGAKVFHSERRSLK